MKNSFLLLALFSLVSYMTIITVVLPTNAYGGSYSNMSFVRSLFSSLGTINGVKGIILFTI